MILSQTMEAKRVFYNIAAAGGLFGLIALSSACESQEPQPNVVLISRSSPTPEGSPLPPTPTARIASRGNEGTSNPQIKPTLNITATVQAALLATATAEEMRRQAALRRPTLQPPTYIPKPISTMSGSYPTSSR